MIQLFAGQSYFCLLYTSVTGAALTLLADKEERAYFVAAAEKYNVYGMKGYADDGYCSEGRCV